MNTTELFYSVLDSFTKKLKLILPDYTLPDIFLEFKVIEESGLALEYESGYKIIVNPENNDIQNTYFHELCHVVCDNILGYIKNNEGHHEMWCWLMDYFEQNYWLTTQEALLLNFKDEY